METSCILNKKRPLPEPNISPDEYKAFRELKEDQSRVVLTADKGVAMVVMDMEDYMDEAHLLLADTHTYKPMPKNPTNKFKYKLSQTLRDIKTQG